MLNKMRFGFFLFSLALLNVQAADIKVISSVGMKAALEQMQPQFESATAHKLVLVLGTAVPLKRRIDEGESFDVVILTPSMIEDLGKQGKTVLASHGNVAKTGLGVAVARGEAKPDISSVEGMKNALLKARMITYTKEGQSGVATARMIERLGLAEQMKSRTHLDTRPGGGLTTVHEGKADLAFALVSEIVPSHEVDFAGPFPPELQSYVVFAAGISPSAKDALAAKALIDYLHSPQALGILKKLGMEGG
jgi:molybdate transport system substrate-binding protein